MGIFNLKSVSFAPQTFGWGGDVWESNHMPTFTSEIEVIDYAKREWISDEKAMPLDERTAALIEKYEKYSPVIGINHRLMEFYYVIER